ncbi:hypothetical protein ACS0TY_018453 [Phlomoides rotata]
MGKHRRRSMVVRFPHRFRLCERTLQSREATPPNRFKTFDQTNVPSSTPPPRDGVGQRGEGVHRHREMPVGNYVEVV